MNVQSILEWAKGFVTEQMPQSSTRLIAIVATFAAVLCAPAIVVFAFFHPEKAATIAALVGMITALSGLVATALAVRKKNPDSGDPG